MCKIGKKVFGAIGTWLNLDVPGIRGRKNSLRAHTIFNNKIKIVRRRVATKVLLLTTLVATGCSHRNLRTRSGMHLCLQDDRNGQKMMVSADKTRLNRFIILYVLYYWKKYWQVMAKPLRHCHQFSSRHHRSSS
jgi:hypothetical protein